MLLLTETNYIFKKAMVNITSNSCFLQSPYCLNLQIFCNIICCLMLFQRKGAHFSNFHSICAGCGLLWRCWRTTIPVLFKSASFSLSLCFSVISWEETSVSKGQETSRRKDKQITLKEWCHCVLLVITGKIVLQYFSKYNRRKPTHKQYAIIYLFL